MSVRMGSNGRTKVTRGDNATFSTPNIIKSVISYRRRTPRPSFLGIDPPLGSYSPLMFWIPPDERKKGGEKEVGGEEEEGGGKKGEERGEEGKGEEGRREEGGDEGRMEGGVVI